MTTPHTPAPTTPAPAPATAPKPAARQLLIQSTSHIPQLNVSLVYQGQPKSGKTTYAFSWPSPFGLFCDKNLGTLRDFPGVPYVTPQTWEEIERDWIPAIANRRLSELVQSFTDENGIKPYPQYKVRTLVLDSFTNFLNMNYNELEQIAPLGKTGEKDGYWIWREYFNRANRFINVCTQATIHNPKRPQLETYHFVGTVHEKVDYDAEGRVLDITASVQGKLSTQFASYFDAVLLTECMTGSTVELPPEKPGAPPSTKRLKNYFIHAADASNVRKSAISGEFSKLPPKLKGDYATLEQYLKLEGENK